MKKLKLKDIVVYKRLKKFVHGDTDNESRPHITLHVQIKEKYLLFTRYCITPDLFLFSILFVHLFGF